MREQNSATDAEPPAEMPRPNRRAKYTAMLATVLSSGLVLLAATQNWYALHLNATANHDEAVSVQGSLAAPALTALALAGLALTAALAIGGRIARLVLGVLGVVIGACILFSAFAAIGDPAHAGATAVTTATGVAGDASVTHLVDRVDASVWPWVAVAGGILLLAASVVVLVTSPRWPGPSRKYQATRLEPTNSRDSAIDSWDELSHGEDPTVEDPTVEDPNNADPTAEGPDAEDPTR